jgi:hypothetical protein
MFGFGKKQQGTAEERVLETVLLELAGWSEADSQALEDTLLRIAPGVFAGGSTLTRLPVEKLVAIVWAQIKAYWPQVVMHAGNLDVLKERWSSAWRTKQHLVADKLQRLQERVKAEHVL